MNPASERRLDHRVAKALLRARRPEETAGVLQAGFLTGMKPSLLLGEDELSLAGCPGAHHISCLC